MQVDPERTPTSSPTAHIQQCGGGCATAAAARDDEGPGRRQRKWSTGCTSAGTAAWSRSGSDQSSSAGVEGEIAVEHGEERRGRHGRQGAAVRLAAHLADPLVVLVLVVDQRHQQRPGHDP